MNRRIFLSAIGAACIGGSRLAIAETQAETQESGNNTMSTAVETLELSEAEWRERLTPEQFDILRDEGTERAYSSPLNQEKREGVYHCAGCDLSLFHSDAKYDSGTGWPSFFRPIEDGHIGTKRDFKLIWPRTEYHCARCGGHQGHVFDDGPEPTGKRYCNNGLALVFKPTAT